MEWLRKAAENGDANSCEAIARLLYQDQPYAREVGHVESAAGVHTTAGGIDGHDIPPNVRTGVVFWLRKGRRDLPEYLDTFRRIALNGSQYCYNYEGCTVVGHLQEFKVCPQCKTARYCSDACQKQDWTAGGHKETCGTSESKFLGLHS
jgi:hypothetical protein